MRDENATGDAPRLYQAVLAHVQSGLWNDVRNAQTLAWMVTGLLLSHSPSLPVWIPHNPIFKIYISTNALSMRHQHGLLAQLESAYSPTQTPLDRRT